jgi:NAD(P)-dependent dehydrogenase (short-subunit alcohol dehydrogenase family)
MIHAKYNDLFGKTALITGGQGFLGKALCEEYASQGVNLVILDKAAEDLDFTLKLRNKGVEIEFYQVDFESNESRKKVIENVFEIGI